MESAHTITLLFLTPVRIGRVLVTRPSQNFFAALAKSYLNDRLESFMFFGDVTEAMIRNIDRHFLIYEKHDTRYPQT